LQLTVSRLLVIAVLLALAAPARAEDSWNSSLSYFTEPQKKEPLHVFHPAMDLAVDAHRTFSFLFGYNADVVTGATPRIYGAALDAISSATNFNDTRHAFHGGVEARIGPVTLDAGYTFAFENDYRSHAIDAAARVDLWGKNTTFKLGYAHNFDAVCDADNRGATPLERRALGTSKGCFDSNVIGIVEEPLAIDSYFASWTQVLSPILLSELSVSFQALDGFQSNPYREVLLFSGTVLAQEAEPLLRQRVAVQGRLHVALKKLHAAVGGLGRFYWDTWNIKSGTIEATYDQYIVPQFLLRVRGRFYQQGRALFYRDAGEPLSYENVGPVGQYFTGDREMSPFRNWLVGLKLTYAKTADERGKIGRVFEALDLNAKFDLIFYEPLTPLPPNKDRNYALVLMLGLATRW
jgi:hypothetical protein